MAETPFAVASDVADRWRPLTPAEEQIATVLVGDASDMIREQFPDVDERLAAGSLRYSTVVRVVAGMVKRAISNMDGKRQESIDDYSYMLDREVSAGYLFLSASDQLALQPVKRRRAFAVDLG